MKRAIRALGIAVLGGVLLIDYAKPLRILLLILLTDVALPSVAGHAAKLLLIACAVAGWAVKFATRPRYRLSTE